ncbi:FAD-dependent oxidoreductase [Rubrivivax albus]|uniref:Pyridine nucleotide-disulfide oxidoreductase n=1 Tax=Rubrivivax albus TaxID=2499835 RepID=A0A3S2VV37_9BURK|nr:FAD-dependent oxidoreductase [Rubrivivax albus]RVT49609.1 pyridine nucleotide-disulfide oxidoreductase [Rubrivivax albus]
MARRSKTPLWAGVALLAMVLAWAWRHYDLGHLLTLEQLKGSRDALQALVAAEPLRTAAAFFVVYVAAAALSIPGAVVLTLAAGAMFGLGWGLLLVSFASSVGALLAFLVARYLLRDVVQSRFAQALAPVNDGMRRDGVFYLLTLRLVPVFPFWLVNLVMGLTPIGAARFYAVSQVGMLAGTVVYVNAGTQLGAIQSPSDILSPGLLVSFILLGLFPLVAKAVVAWVRQRKLYARWPRPRRFDRNLVVIGAGAGGLVSAYIAAAVKAKVTLVEGHRMGGDCLNFGCVPSKALIRSAKLAKQLGKAHELGVADAGGRVDFAAVMQRVQQVVKDIAPHDSVERYTSLGVEVLQGHARITSPWTVEVTGADGKVQALSTRAIVIAAGASPFVPPIPGLAEVGCLTSDTVWGLTELPRRLVVLGGGPIGSELAQSFARLGSEVTQVEMAPRIMVREDPEVSDLVAASLRADGVQVLTGHQATRVERQGGEKRLIATHDGHEVVIPFDELLCAVGRSPRVTGYGLEELGLPLTSRRTIETNDHLQTLYPNIYAVGDVAGPYQFTHTAAHQAWYAAVNALFGRFRKFKADYRVIPWATFTDPEVARVGLSETEARERGIAFEVTRYGLDDLDRAIADGTAHGFVKVLTVPGKDRILGVTIVGEHAGDLLAEYVLAMKHGLGLNKILGTIHTYPTLAEANKYVAGEWKRAHAPARLLEWVGRYHAWERA